MRLAFSFALAQDLIADNGFTRQDEATIGNPHMHMRLLLTAQVNKSLHGAAVFFVVINIYCLNASAVGIESVFHNGRTRNSPNRPLN